jgi:wobble nucleotide-excising tRNase
MKIIQAVTKINDFASFKKYKPSAELPNFKRFNLIYGWNGSGKTCFSRILRSFELASPFFDNSDCEPVFEFKLSDGSSINNLDLTAFKNIRVFNKDFIDENIFCDNGPKPIFFIGKQSKEDKDKIIEAETNLQKLKDNFLVKETRYNKARENSERALTDKARDIRTALTTPMREDRYRNYDRTTLDDFIKQNLEMLKNPTTLILSDQRIGSIKKSIIQQNKPKISKLSYPDFNTSNLETEIQSYLSKAVTSQIISKLRDDEVISKWVEKGLEIHKLKALKICAFCDQTIQSNRISILEKHFNDEYQNLLNSIQELKKKCNSRYVKVQFVESSMFYEDLASEYMAEKKIAEEDIARFNSIIESFIKILEKKEKNLFAKLSFNKTETVNDNSFKKINDIISRHNKKSDNFDTQIDKDKKDFELHLIAEFLPSYNDILRENEQSKRDYVETVDFIKRSESEIKTLKENLISHHIPIQQINRHLKQFLGYDEIQIQATESKEGYKITRNGVIAKNLSEGEKTALAIVYFLAKINEEGFNLASSVIVIDDPVSSLDSNAIFQSFSFIKESIKQAGQIFILTHHFDFFRQAKNWFKYCKKEHSFYMMVNSNASGVRESSLIPIDDLLVKYESEYHFLFSILYKISVNKEKNLEKVYSIPNVARKFLENFLAFRIPILKDKEPSTHTRLEEIVYDKAKKTRIERFIETHSHPRYESGVQDFDMTILSETSAIVEDLLALVKTEDEKHYSFLLKSIV